MSTKVVTSPAVDMPRIVRRIAARAAAHAAGCVSTSQCGLDPVLFLAKPAEQAPVARGSLCNSIAALQYSNEHMHIAKSVLPEPRRLRLSASGVSCSSFAVWPVLGLPPAGIVGGREGK